MAANGVPTFPSAYKTEIESPLEGNPYETNTCEYEPETKSPSEDSDLEEFEFSSFESYVEEEEEEEEEEEDEEEEEEEESSKSVREGDELKFDLSISDDEEDIYRIPREKETETSKAQRAAYNRQVLESDGFDVDYFPEIGHYVNLIVPISDLHTDTDFFPEIEYFTKFAIRKYRGEEGENKSPPNLELVNIVKANVQACCPVNYYITFEANDMDDSGRLKTYQTMVHTKLVQENSFVELFREKPAHYS